MQSLRTRTTLLFVIVGVTMALQYALFMFVFVPRGFKLQLLPLVAHSLSLELQRHGDDQELPNIEFETLTVIQKPWFMSFVSPPIIVDAHDIVLYPATRAGEQVRRDGGVFAVEPLTGASGTTLYMVIEHMYFGSSITHPQMPLILLANGIATAIVISCIIVFSWWIKKRFLQPLTNLTKQSQQFTSMHNYLAAQLPPGTFSEIITLANVIDQRNQHLVEQISSRRVLNAEIAHELRNPLNAIHGYVEGMRDGVISITPNRLDTVYSEILVLQRIIEDFRILSLVDIHEYTIKPQLMRPSELGAHVMQLMSGNMHKHSFHTAMWVDDYLININVDVERMMQVFKNIIDNAIKYAPAYSTITLTGDAQSDRVIITCSDQGIGIDPSHLPYIFERFYRSPNNPSPGSGIGLAIAKTIIEAHGGQISATSTLGQGTTITILLPVYPNTRIPITD